MKTPIVIYRANCTDGWTAAYIAKKVLGDVELFPGFYGSAPPDCADREVYILDFSYKRSVMEEIARAARSLVVLDHHKTAKADLADFQLPNTKIIFDMDRSGAKIAYDYFGRPESCEIDPLWLVNYVQDRNLYRWALWESREICAAIELYDRTIDGWDELLHKKPSELSREGKIVEKYKKICIEGGGRLARLCKIGDYLVPASNSSEARFASDIAHLLSDGLPFAATYWVRKDGMVQFSLRSREDGVDVSGVAASYGGGGHEHAAGFEVPLKNLQHMFDFGVGENSSMVEGWAGEWEDV